MGILNEGNGGFFMPVAPAGTAYGNGGGNGGDGLGFGSGWWIILLILLAGNGMWGGFGGGFGGMMWPMMMGGMNGGFGLDYLYPWLNNSQHISDGFRDQQLQTSISGLQNSITSGFGDVQLGLAGINQNICQTGNGIVNALNNGFSGAEIAANGRQMANMQQIFGVQTALQNYGCENRAGLADVKYTIASEECNTRAASANNTRDIIDNQTRGTQAILDKLCALELDGVKGQLAAAQRENVGLQNQLNMANLAASQTAQTVNIRDSIIDELRSCPIPSQPVYGSQPIFTCPTNNNNCGCGGAFAA